MKIILASKSPRRKELMKMLNIDFDIMESNATENLIEGLSLEDQSKHLAYIKAKSVLNSTSGNRIVIGSDTIVYKDGIYYGKPKSEEDAFNMISSLSDNINKISTGLAILVEKDGKYYEFLECDVSSVHIVNMSNDEINSWIASGKALDKAGAYSIQDEFAKFIDNFNGNFYSAIGLPINLVYQIIRKFV